MVDNVHCIAVDTLKTLFIVSDANIASSSEASPVSSDWSYTGTFQIPSTSFRLIPPAYLMPILTRTESDVELTLRVRPAPLEKCPRCWTYTRQAEETLCGRCAGALNH